MTVHRPVRLRKGGGRHLYRQGADFERALIVDLERRGFFCIRAAGSRGAADIVALARGHRPLVVQAKRGASIVPAERLKLLDVAERTGAIGLLAFGARGGWSYQEVETGAAWNEVVR